MRIAFFGGTFDPIHLAHLRVATAAADAFALDRVLFAPTGRQALKPAGPSAPFADRLHMASLALMELPDPRFSISSIDAPHPDRSPNYTIHTLQALKLQSPTATLFSLIGADALLTLPRWRSPQLLLDIAEWIIVSRPGVPLTPTDIAAIAPDPTRIHLLTTVHEDISSTAIRHRLQTGDRCAQLLPAAVSAYIQSNNLYRNEIAINKN